MEYRVRCYRSQNLLCPMTNWSSIFLLNYRCILYVLHQMTLALPLENNLFSCGSMKETHSRTPAVARSPKFFSKRKTSGKNEHRQRGTQRLIRCCNFKKQKRGNWKTAWKNDDGGYWSKAIKENRGKRWREIVATNKRKSSMATVSLRIQDIYKNSEHIFLTLPWNLHTSPTIYTYHKPQFLLSILVLDSDTYIELENLNQNTLWNEMLYTICQ